jgi:hypothetical protein
LLVVGLAGQPGVLAEGCVEDRDRLGQRDREVEEQRAEPGLAGGIDPQFASAFGRGMRLAGQQAGIDVLGFPAAAGRLSEGCAVWALRWPNSRSYGPRSTTWPCSKPRAFAPGPHQRPGGSPPLSLAWM